MPFSHSAGTLRASKITYFTNCRPLSTIVGYSLLRNRANVKTAWQAISAVSARANNSYQYISYHHCCHLPYIQISSFYIEWNIYKCKMYKSYISVIQLQRVYHATATWTKTVSVCGRLFIGDKYWWLTQQLALAFWSQSIFMAWVETRNAIMS